MIIQFVLTYGMSNAQTQNVPFSGMCRVKLLKAAISTSRHAIHILLSDTLNNIASPILLCASSAYTNLVQYSTTLNFGSQFVFDDVKIDGIFDISMRLYNGTANSGTALGGSIDEFVILTFDIEYMQKPGRIY